MAKRGQASKYTPAIADEICERLSGGETLRSICRSDGMPAWRTVYDWIGQREDFAASIARARDLGADAIAEEALAIANTPVEGIETEETDDGKVKTKRGDMIAHRRLQVDTRLKLLAKWNPKKYGDKLELAGKVEGGFALIVNPRNRKAA